MAKDLKDITVSILVLCYNEKDFQNASMALHDERFNLLIKYIRENYE